MPPKTTPAKTSVPFLQMVCNAHLDPWLQSRVPVTGKVRALELFNKTIATMCKPIFGVVGGDLGEGVGDGLEECGVGASLSGAQ